MDGRWVLLCYRVPREPSTPRIAVWRRLRALGVAQVGDGVVALPADARTRESLEWVADAVEQAGGTAMLWVAEPVTQAQERRLAEQMRQARDGEYRVVAGAADEAARSGQPQARAAALRRLRTELRKVERRDYFPPASRGSARAALAGLAELVTSAATGPSS